MCWKLRYALGSPLFTKNFTWCSRSAQLCFCRTTKRALPHFAPIGWARLSKHSPASSDKTQRCLCSQVNACKTLWSITVIASTACVLWDSFVIITCLILLLSKYCICQKLQMFLSSNTMYSNIFIAADVEKCNIYSKMYTNYIQWTV